MTRANTTHMHAKHVAFISMCFVCVWCVCEQRQAHSSAEHTAPCIKCTGKPSMWSRVAQRTVHKSTYIAFTLSVLNRSVSITCQYIMHWARRRQLKRNCSAISKCDIDSSHCIIIRRMHEWIHNVYYTIGDWTIIAAAIIQYKYSVLVR